MSCDQVPNKRTNLNLFNTSIGEWEGNVFISVYLHGQCHHVTTTLIFSNLFTPEPTLAPAPFTTQRTTKPQPQPQPPGHPGPRHTGTSYPRQTCSNLFTWTLPYKVYSQPRPRSRETGWKAGGWPSTKGPFCSSSAVCNKYCVSWFHWLSKPTQSITCNNLL